MIAVDVVDEKLELARDLGAEFTINVLPHRRRGGRRAPQLPGSARARRLDRRRTDAAIVNAPQRHADVVVQKSLAEGFGLAVAEAMWKQRPVVASRIGGIHDQMEDDRSGLLLSDPGDLEQAGAAVTALLADSDRAKQMGIAAQRRVQQQFLGPHHLGRYFEIIHRVASQREHYSHVASGEPAA